MSTAVSPEALDDADHDAERGDPNLELVVAPTYSLLARVGAEAFGAFVVVFIGVGVSLWWSVISGPATSVIAVSTAFGIAILGATTAVGQISGGHFNPAATLGAAIGRRLPWADVLPYWVAQLIGALVASTVLFVLMPTGFASATGTSARGWFSNTSNGFGEHSPLWHATEGMLTFGLPQVLAIEILGTAVLVGVILAATDRTANSANATLAIGPAAAVGLTFAGVHALAVPFTNGALNPARATATAIYSDFWAIGQLWMFWVAPLLGGAIAGLVYLLVSPRKAVTGNWPDDQLELVHGPDSQATDVVARGQSAETEYADHVETDRIDELLARGAARADEADDAAPPSDATPR